MEQKEFVETVESFMAENEFVDDSWPNYTGWLKHCKTFNIIVSMNSWHARTFDIAICGPIDNSASDPHGKNPDKFRPLAIDVNLERVKAYVELLGTSSDR